MDPETPYTLHSRRLSLLTRRLGRRVWALADATTRPAAPLPIINEWASTPGVHFLNSHRTRLGDSGGC